MKNKSTQALQDYIRYSRYARYIDKEERRETWQEQINRVFKLHENKYKQYLNSNTEFQKLFNQAKTDYENQLFLGSQRILQFAGDVNNPEAECPIMKHQARVYNCVTTAIDRDRAFSETMYMLLCGCGVGFSVQKQHINQLPNVHPVSDNVVGYMIEDSIEGWACAIGVLIASYFRQSHDDEYRAYYGNRVDFDFSLIRPKGSYITGGFKAPGPEGLKTAISKMKQVFENRVSSLNFSHDEFKDKLRPIDAYDLIMHSSDAVLSGGVRRSATICLFSKDDTDMLAAKTGNWFIDNPQRGRSNNSVMLLRNETKKQEFLDLMKSVENFGEPGFIWVDDLDTMYNPCVEIGMHPFYYDAIKGKKSGFQGCNLCEINGKAVKTKELFFQACISAAVVGTMQAGYTDFKYLTKSSKKIFELEALLGISITGFMDNPKILLNPEILKEGAKLIVETNEKVAKMININPAARTTCVKPAGSTSALLGTSSGCHGHHSKRYIRHTQVNKEETAGQMYQLMNSEAVEESVWSANNTDNVIAFLIESNKDAILKDDLLDTKQLDAVKLIQQNWVEPGTIVSRCVNKTVRHNVSNTINVTNWNEVGNYIYDNREFLAGVSFISHTGDKDYPQAPFTSVFTAEEILEKYGQGALFASGLIVDGLKAFDNKLWLAIDSAIKYSNPSHFSGLDLKNANPNTIFNLDEKKNWCLRFNKFAKNFTEKDTNKCNYLLKDVYNLHKWNRIALNYSPINWDKLNVKESFTDIDSMGAIACQGNNCEIK